MHVRSCAWILSLPLVAVVACSSGRERTASGSEPRPTRAAAPTSSPVELPTTPGTAPSIAGSTETAPPSVSLASTPPGVAAVPTAPAAAPAVVPAAREIEGLRVTPNADGTIRIEGTDRWGGDATTTYESVEFLEPALPVLERSLSPAQVAGLTALVAEIRGR